LAKAKTSSDNFETMLRRELRSAPAASTSECVGPEVLAAYYDRTLSRAERNRVESHLASCPRCLSMTASIARADDSALERPREHEETARGFFWLTRVLAPITMLGIVIAIAIGIRNREQPKSEMIALASPSVSRRLELAERAPAAPPAFEIGASKSKAPSIATPPIAGTSNETFRAEESAGDEFASKQYEAPQEREKAVAAGKYSPAPGSSAMVSGDANLASAAPHRMQMQSRVAASGAVASGSTAMMAKGAAINIVRSPDRSVAWRFGTAGTIARWTNSTAWLPQRSGVSTDLLAGASASNDVCWMVGKSGTVIRTLDGGAHWQLITPPSRQNFVSITATDSNNASIVGANGARFSTRDGGVTWSSP
jgi:hypothetical protein